MHFMNPVPVMALVELAKGMHTSHATFEASKGLAEFLGKSVCMSQDRPVGLMSMGRWNVVCWLVSVYYAFGCMRM